MILLDASVLIDAHSHYGSADARRLRFRRCGDMRKPVSLAQEKIADGGNLFRIWAV